MSASDTDLICSGEVGLMRTTVEGLFGDPAVPWLSWELDGIPGAEWPALAAAVMLMLRALVPADAVVWNGFDRATGAVAALGDPPELYGPEDAQLTLGLDDHPMMQAYLNGGPAFTATPLRISDLVSARRFHATRTWADLFRPREVEHQLAVPTGGDLRTVGVGWSLNRRGRDFTDDELDLIRRLQPVLCAVEQPRTWQLSPSATERPPGLSARELEVLALVADGLTALAVAHRLRIAEATVRKHLEHIYAKTGCRDRLLAAQYARDRGLITRRMPISTRPRPGAAPPADEQS